MAAQKKTARRSSAKGSRKTLLKDPKGGLTAAGRRAFKQKEGANLEPGVKGPADTPEKMRRKGSFLRRHFANPRGPMMNEKGQPTRLALSAHAWGERVPKNLEDAKKLAEKGERLLQRYKKAKEKTQAESKSPKASAHKSSSKTSAAKFTRRRSAKKQPA